MRHFEIFTYFFQYFWTIFLKKQLISTLMWKFLFSFWKFQISVWKSLPHVFLSKIDVLYKKCRYFEFFAYFFLNNWKISWNKQYFSVLNVKFWFYFEKCWRKWWKKISKIFKNTKIEIFLIKKRYMLWIFFFWYFRKISLKKRYFFLKILDLSLRILTIRFYFQNWGVIEKGRWLEILTCFFFWYFWKFSWKKKPNISVFECMQRFSNKISISFSKTVGISLKIFAIWFL